MSTTLRLDHAFLMSRLGIAFLTWRRFLQKRLSPYRITLKQQYVLRQLAKTDYVFPSDIAVMLFCDRPTATVVIDNLAKQGWVVRKRDNNNRKFIRIAITPAGRSKMRELAAMQSDPFDPLACFTTKEMERFAYLLEKLNDHLSQIKDFREDDEN